MQVVGHLSAQAKADQSIYDAASERLSQWLAQKSGQSIAAGTIRQMVSNKDRGFTVTREIIESPIGVSESIIITEGLEDDRNFQTSLALTFIDGQLGVSARLETARRGDMVAIVEADPRCPAVYRDILNMPLAWSANRYYFQVAPRRYVGEAGGEEIVGAICHPDRPIPLIVISERDKFTFDPNLPTHLSYDLPSLAEIAIIDPEASWVLTESLGRRWGCYQGAIRIYWPGFDLRNSVPERTCWTAEMLRGIHQTHNEAVNIFRGRMRRAIFRRSAWRAGIFDELESIRLASQEEKFKAHTAALALNDDASHAVADIWRQYEDSQEVIRQKDLDIFNLKTQLEFANERIAALSADARPVTSETLFPGTIDQAVSMARSKFAGLLMLGDDVPSYLLEISDRALPPEAIYQALEKLADLAKILNSSETIGMSHCQWLTENGFRASGEKPMTMANDRNRLNRTFHDGEGKSLFLDHIKLRDNCPRNECVRIYFKYIPERRYVSIGLIGPHPE